MVAELLVVVPVSARFVAVVLLWSFAPVCMAAQLLVDQGPYDANLGARNSNTLFNTGSDQQVADDFVITGAGVEVTRMAFWFTYQDLVIDQIPASAPQTQAMLIQIFRDNGSGDPGEEVYEANVNLVPEATGDQNGFLTPNDIYYAEIDLAHPFQPSPGERYWLSPLGFDDDVTWQWQLADSEGERRSRGGEGNEIWRRVSLQGEPLNGDFAYRLFGNVIPEPSQFVFGVITLLTMLRRRR